MSNTLFTTPFGEINLQRLPIVDRDPLQAWDAADSLLLQTLADQNIQIESPLICNDPFGAITVALNSFTPTSWSDSRISHSALRKNLVLNKLDQNSVNILESMSEPKVAPKLVLIKLPKTLGLLEDQLIRLKPLLNAESKVFVAGMVKHMPSSVWKLLERLVGPTATGLAVKKAKVIEVTVDMDMAAVSNPYPVRWKLENTELELISHANVFSRDKLDIGTRFMLEHLPVTEGQGDIIDLGCGNGVLALMSALQNPQAHIHCVDESYMAIASAQQNFKQLESISPSAERQVHFHASNGMGTFAHNSADLVLCNPPFHQNQSVGDALAKSMFRESEQVLRPGGELWVVGNRHLGYHQRLRQFFDRITQVAFNQKFVILKATKSLLDEGQIEQAQKLPD